MPLTWLYQDPLFFLAWVSAVLIALSIHEFSHAAAARALGDATAEMSGRLTLNPLAHLDPLGFLMLVFVGFGWAKPVPVNLLQMKNQRLGAAVVSLAGPAANLIGVFVFGVLLHFIAPALGPNNLLVTFLLMLVMVNVVLLVFNLLPIPPLDGSKVLFSLLPDSWDELKLRWEMYGPWALLLLVILDSFLPQSILGQIFNAVFSFLGRFI